MYSMITLLLVVALTAAAEARFEHAAARPLRFPALVEGEYVFDWQVEWRQTMTYYDGAGHRHLVFYNADNEEQRHEQTHGHADQYSIEAPALWRGRKNQLQPCDKMEPIHDQAILDNIIPYAGLHQDVMAINGRSPSEDVIVPFGAEVVVRVHNNLLAQSITVHIHGFDKFKLWFTDGVSHVQQCPIQPGTSYAYRFIADTPGTHWFHGHLGVDRGEGLLGSFIVLPEKDESSLHDEQYIVMLQDWTIPTAHDVWYNHIGEGMKFLKGPDDLSQCWAPTRTYDGTNVPGSVPLRALLANARGWHNQSDVRQRPWALPLERFQVNPGERVLFRLIGGMTAQHLMVGFEDHQMTIVSADGAPIKETKADLLIIFSGERYDVVIETLEEPERREYYIIIETMEYYAWDGQKTEPFYGVAVLEYSSSGLTPNRDRRPDFTHSSCSVQKPCTVVNCPFANFPAHFPYQCVPAGALRSTRNAPPDVMQTHYEAGFEEHFLNMHFDSHINGWRFVAPKAPPYLYPEDETKVAKPCLKASCPPNANRLVPGCFCFYHLNMTLGNIVQLTVYNMGEGSEAGHGFSHPLHIHGTHFYVMKMGFPSYNGTTGVQLRSNDDLPCNDPLDGKCNDASWTHKDWLGGNVADMNTVDPSSRDTLVIPAGGYVVLRFKAVNAGWFYAHCHVMIHHMGGMAFALRVGTRDQMARPPPDFPKDCGHFEPAPLIKANLNGGLVRHEQPDAASEEKDNNVGDGYLSTHVLDVGNGKTAADIVVSAFAQLGNTDNYGVGQFEMITQGKTDVNGRIGNVLSERQLTEGVYKLRFEIAAYYEQIGQQSFYPFAELVFRVDDANAHYHVPLLLSNFGYTTYKGQ